MYVSFLFFAFLFLVVFLVVSASFRLLLKKNVEKKLDKAENYVESFTTKLRKKNIPLPIAMIIIILFLVLMIAFGLSEKQKQEDTHHTPATRHYTGETS